MGAIIKLPYKRQLLYVNGRGDHANISNRKKAALS